MISAALFVFGVFACFQNGESVISWTTPSGASGVSATLTPTVNEQDITTAAALTGVKVVAATDVASKVIDAYTITQNSFSLFTVTITSAEGIIGLAANKGLDYEFQSSHILIITADDDDTTPGTGTATVTITVENLTTDPVWPSLRYCVTIADQAAASTSLTTITATDTDTSSINYGIVSSTVFEITTAGLIQVKSGQTTQRGVTPRHVLEVTANDGTLTSTTIVHVCVGSSTQCTGCGSSADCSGAASITISVISLLSLLLLIVV